MKIKNLIITTIATLAMLNAINVRADVFQYLSFNVTSFDQREIIDDGTNTVAPAPHVQAHTTSDLLSIIAKDKNAQGNWPSNSFPAGTKLGVTGSGSFLVVNGTNVLVDTSDFLSFTHGDYEVVSGKKNDSTGLSNPNTRRLHIGRLNFDDTSVTNGANLKFYIQGVVTDSETDTKPVNNVYIQTRLGKLSNGTGEGVDSGTNYFILTGTVTATGKGTQTLVP